MRQNYKDIDTNLLKELVSTSDSYSEVTKKLGFDPYKTNARKNIERLIKSKGVETGHFSTVQRVFDTKKRYNKDILSKLIEKSGTYKEVLDELDILPIFSNYRTLKKYLEKYNIDYSHLKTEKRKDHRIINTDYSKENIEKIILQSQTFYEVFEKLGIGKQGNNYKTIRNYIKKYDIDISHFNPNKVRTEKLRKFNTTPLTEILIENSTYRGSGNNLKQKLYKEGLKKPICEKCGQDEWWHGEKISLILDHINGIHTDNRIENLRIVCPNCEATLPTHCGKNTKIHRNQK